jgi:hypothetical protein
LDGELVWSHTVSNRRFVRSAPTVANDVVYDGGQSGASLPNLPDSTARPAPSNLAR